MKVTALIPESLIEEVKALSKGKNITESLIIVMEEWVSSKKLQALNERIKKKPLKFDKNFSAEKIRSLNRKLT